MINYLSKSDFMLAHDCPTKLYYKKMGYPSVDDGNEYLHYLARGGYMVGKMATLFYPTGVLIDTDGDYAKAIKLTKEYLKRDKITLFEAAIESKGKLIRIDILEKKNNKFNLIEVKSKSYETSSEEKIVKKNQKELEDYIIDVAYQYLVLQEAFPKIKIQPWLFLPDKSKNTKIEGLNLLFRIEEPKNNTGFRKYNVIFDDSKTLNIVNYDIMTLVNVEQRVLELQEMIKEEIDLLLPSLNNGIKKIKGDISKHCFKCEYIGDVKCGYDECFYGYPKVEHHVKDIYHIGTIGGYNNPLVNELIKNKKLSITDIPFDYLTGVRGDRQLIQINNTLAGTEWRSRELKGKLKRWEYPLHFIDFETTISALPFHKGMRPYEAVAFQWSCHTIKKPGSEPVHSEWINLEPEFPNFRFAESLMKQIGRTGTVLMWATHENTILRTIYNQFEKYEYKNDDLYEWLEYIVKFDKDDTGKLLDMNKFTLENYFHPLMKGKTSIKWTLPAVLSAYKSKRITNWLINFEEGLSLYQRDKKGNLINPYLLLPPIDIYEKAETVNEGTGAMRAYEDLMFGVNKGNDMIKQKYSEALKKYCKLDTLAMLIIWEHWSKP